MLGKILLLDKAALAHWPIHPASNLCVACMVELSPSILPLFLCSQGYGLTYVLMFARIRLGLHKHAKEGLTCLLESCTQREYDRVGTRQLLHCLLRV